MAHKRAAIYARISDDKKGEGLGVQRQVEDCQALAEARSFEVVEVYTDNDVSAYSGKTRPNYRRMLEAVEDGRIEAVIYWHSDRLHRSPLELEEYIALSKSHSIENHAVQGGEVDLSTPEGILRAGLLGQVARYESAHKAERVRRAQEQNAMSGKWLGGSRPFGWQIVDGTPVLDDREAQIVRDAHSHVLAGLSLGSFIEQLTERGITTARGGAWSYATLRQMLLRPRNAGLAEWKGKVVGESEFPAIVERHVWEATRSKLTDPTRRRSQTNKVKHLLAGIALCECLRPVKSGQITDRKGVKHMIYRCSESGPGHVNKRMSYVDEHVERHILVFLAYAARRQASAPSDPAILERLMLDEAAHRERLNEAARLFADGAIDGEQLTEMSKGIKTKLSAIQEQLAKLDEQNARLDQVELSDAVDWSDLDQSGEEWRSLHIERKRAWIRSRFVIVLHRHTRGSARVFDPGTVQIMVRTTLDEPVPMAAVEQWKQEQAAGARNAPYQIMVEPKVTAQPRPAFTGLK
ncbi:DNA invertase Pin-like site-specific DNA recombinase [Paenarthrobacter nitroguajacolicus]|uniref:recombinase family protein n=1 Tax=Paenarthrobacter nitroguajacolicus TaxID=211146 RepID=UPI002856C5BC|nr:recombinase family protein [Paenarthrobacter nitroguajacolicus]MDR6988967.1 DNA invertase Pin-like site-specific DNA recombinase [Paenarthrobacter nitroguajacolicus]